MTVAQVSLWLLPVALAGQGYRGDVVVKSQPAERVVFSRLRFLGLTFGREGPMYFPIKGSPGAGREYLVEADVFGVASVAALRFELQDAQGRLLDPLVIWKETDSMNDGEFMGFVRVPTVAFRAVMTGIDRSGVPLRQALPLVRPAASGGAEETVLPPGMPEEHRQKMTEFVEQYRSELKSRAAQAAADHPGGLITLAKSAVLRMNYEPLYSPLKAVIGIRLKYAVLFGADATVRVVPHVAPWFQTPDWRGVVALKGLAGSITPLPEMVGAGTLRDVIVYGGAATYRRGVTYEVTVDMVPDYVIQGELSGKFCLYEEKFASNRERWKALVADTAAVPYNISLFDLDYHASVPVFYSQKALREGFIKSGAGDCGASSSVRF